MKKLIVIQMFNGWAVTVIEVEEGQKKYEGRLIKSIYVCDFKEELKPIIKEHNEYIEKSKNFMGLSRIKLNTLRESNKK